ncbi:ROK family protein [Kutzneria viridogrisea]|uniref:ROK family protein n=2 Tax=Kutzneria TaxID=43356 RepID=W5VYZ0_9PSEU|nr:ROK family protein [Kutzneria albida]AHH93526.1 ROK family protein [Kutzneria albida DSM 43870]MBA8929088.1 glucokinase [Kutzneria viridogrisea]
MTARWAVGVDVGGTKIAGALVGADGVVRGRTVVPTPARDGARAVLAAMAELVRALAAGTPVVGVGVGTGGVVDAATGTVLSATDLLPGWAGTDVAGELRALTGLPVRVDNDGNALALGEHHFGAGRGLRDGVYVTVGTGIGGGIVLDGVLRRGATHSAGELGHLPVPGAEGRRCSCGATGHVEAVASGPAMTSRYREVTGEQVTDLRAIAERALAGEQAASAVLAEGGAALGAALAGLANALDPQVVVLGGGVAEIGEPFLGPVERALRSAALPGPSRVALRPALLGTDAPLAGAAVLAFEGER